MRRVVVTGLGALTPLGNNLHEYWEGLKNGVSGAVLITRFNTEKFKTKFACELKGYDSKTYFDRKEANKLDLYSQYALIATEEAITDSGLNLEKVDKDRIGVIWGSGIGGLETFYLAIKDYVLGDGTPRFSPFFIPKMIGDIAAGVISIKYGFRGPNFATVSACAS
jgi:3-oxoacyl-[acyl-carrier-protein] synthase II